MVFKRALNIRVAMCLTAIGIFVAPIASTATPAAAEEGSHHARVSLQDDCDPTTFNAVLGDRACVGRGETTFKEFIAELTQDRVASDWTFDPEHLSVRPGATIVLRNDGGETHTFTLVKHFGGGVVKLLNDLSGNPVPVPEVSEIAREVILAGATRTISAQTKPGLYKYECLIHPWMRATVNVKAKGAGHED
jgi:plastocyanin